MKIFINFGIRLFGLQKADLGNRTLHDLFHIHLLHAFIKQIHAMLFSFLLAHSGTYKIEPILHRIFCIAVAKDPFPALVHGRNTEPFQIRAQPFQLFLAEAAVEQQFLSDQHGPACTCDHRIVIDLFHVPVDLYQLPSCT